jgi:hypothetical protein
VSDTLIALRVGTAQWLEDTAFARLLTFLERQPNAVDELAFFTSTTHAPLPLDEVEHRCERLGKILPQVKQRGYQVGINVLTSMGHHEEDLPHSLSVPWPRVTDPEGRVSLGSFCPGSPELLDYVTQVYTLVAQAKPDFIWVDDDVRLMGHMPVRATCFCDGCIARFSQETGISFTRSSLIAALQGTPTTERDALRDRWLEHNCALITQLLCIAAEATHRVDPTIQMGFMTGDRFYEGYAFAEWASALAGERSGPARWRPGGGFYVDDEYMGMIDKAHAIGRQVSQLPSEITVVQSEIENFPYQRLRKSVAITMLEAATHMAAGTTGTAFNILGMQPDPLDEYVPFLEQIGAFRPFYQALLDTMGRSPAMGVWPAWHRNIFANHGVDGNWLQQNQSVEALHRPYVLAELGLPIAYAPEGACVTALAGPLPAAFTEGELEHIFRGGVLLDASALHTLTQLGLHSWAGVQVADVIEHDMTEVLTSHPLNGQFAGWSRDCRQSFWSQPAYRLEPVLPGVEVLAHLTDYAQQDWGPTMTAFENSLGGRIVVMGYFPWTLIHNLAKSSQLKLVCRWLSRETMPVVVESYARAIVWVRTSVDDRLVLMILNASLDPVPELLVRVRTTVPTATCLSLAGQSSELYTVPDGNDYVRVAVPDVMPWTVYLLQF